jgi:cell division septal protein FtsQ
MKKFKIIISFIIAAGLVFSGVVLSGMWKEKSEIKSIDLIGNTTLSKNEIFEFAKLSDSLLVSEKLNLQMIEERISKHPNINSVNAKRESSRLIIEVSEKDPFAVIMPSAKNKSMLMIDDKLNLYHYKKEMKNLNLPVISGLSEDLDISNVSKEDYSKMKIAYCIISRIIKIDKLLYNYVSEIHFPDSVSIVLYTFEDAVPVYLFDYSSLDPNSITFKEILSEKLIQFYNLIKQVLIYKTRNSIESIDLRYYDTVIIRNKQNKS